MTANETLKVEKHTKVFWLKFSFYRYVKSKSLT